MLPFLSKPNTVYLDRVHVFLTAATHTFSRYVDIIFPESDSDPLRECILYRSRYVMS